MQNQSAQYRALLEKLDAFTRKYYLNELLRGCIFSAIYVLLFFMAINVLEYYLYLPSLYRKVLFFGFLGSSLLFAARFAGMPLLHYYRLGQLISYEKASEIIGSHFSEVKDKLLNILQLNKLLATDQYDLLQAGIDQKIAAIRPVQFTNAINLKANRKYLKYLLPPVLLFLFIIIAAPNMITESSNRLLHSDTHFERQAPFQFLVENEKPVAVQFDNYDLRVTTTGSKQPTEMLIETQGQILRMHTDSANHFSHRFVNVQRDIDFRLSAHGFTSMPYTIRVIPKPAMATFDVALNYPAYTGRKNEVLQNTGDLTVPAGTRIRWVFTAKNTEQLTFAIGDSLYHTNRQGNEQFSFGKTFLQSAAYTLRVSNKNIANADSVSYTVTVVPDLYPTISVNEKRDSLNDKYFYYIGEVSDDYGLRSLTFNYQIVKAGSEGSSDIPKTETVSINSPSTFSRFTYFWNITQFNLQPGDRMNYYFEVFDNDGVHGSKSTRSSLLTFEMPSLNEMEKQVQQKNEEIKDDLERSMKDAQKMKDQLRDMQDRMMEKKNPDWQDKKNLSNLADKQKELQQQLEEIKDKLSRNFEKQDEFKDLSEGVKEKQKKLQDLMESLMNSEMKELLKKLEQMLDQLQKKDALNNMSDMEFNNEKLEKELDRMLELFKKLEFEQKLTETIDKLEKLAQQQDELNRKTEEAAQQEKSDKQNNAAEAKKDSALQKQQDDLKKELQDAKNDMQDLKKMNDELDAKQDFKEAEQSLQNAEQQMDQAKQDMQSGKKQSASKNQKSASNNMRNAASRLSQMQSNMQMEQMDEDIQALRQLLENIVKLSFDQEKLMALVKSTNINTPKYFELMQQQQKIKTNSKMVEDSLYALAKRVYQIESFVTKEISGINKHMASALDALEERNIFKATGEQQFVMTGYNNLALMLSESLQQMQQSMAESESQCNKPGNKSKANCKKPGSGLPNMSQMQKQLNDKISQLSEMMKRDGQQGQGQKQGDKGMSKQFAEMAKQQAEIRKALEKMNQQENKDGKNSLGNLGEAIDQMNKTETQLVNKQLTTEMLMRQQQILTRLLEAENAQRQRGEQEERESNTGRDANRKTPPSLEEYLKARQNETDFYKALPPSLKPFYKSLAEQYFRNITIR